MYMPPWENKDSLRATLPDIRVLTIYRCDVNQSEKESCSTRGASNGPARDFRESLAQDSRNTARQTGRASHGQRKQHQEEEYGEELLK